MKYPPAPYSRERRDLGRTSLWGRVCGRPGVLVGGVRLGSLALPEFWPAPFVPRLALRCRGMCPGRIPKPLVLPPPPGGFTAAAGPGLVPAWRGGAALRIGMCLRGP